MHRGPCSSSTVPCPPCTNRKQPTPIGYAWPRLVQREDRRATRRDRCGHVAARGEVAPHLSGTPDSKNTGGTTERAWRVDCTNAGRDARKCGGDGTTRDGEVVRAPFPQRNSRRVATARP